MNDVIIRASELTKVYRLYAKAHYRFFDMLGLLPNNKKTFKEHPALTDINLEVRRGEKVAIIGRNGAGKSTLLKLISNVIQPTSGKLEVRGKARALLQIGTGFHPDFTGRENVYAYLAYLGLTGKQAEQRLSEIVDFSELEDYIDQPIKTYSTGMAVRLMFATSTAVAPDILVLDEILSVGDAYFSHKSFDRITELSERNGTTLLLVSHDIYSAAKLCPRVIWLDRGQVLIDGGGPTVVKAYEDSIREQEEQRLRRRKQIRLEEISKNSFSENLAHFIIEIRSRNNKPQPSPVYFSRVELIRSGEVLASLPLESRDAADGTSHLQMEGSTWGEPVMWHGRVARPMLNFGGPFHKVTGVFVVVNSKKVENADFELSVDYWAEAPSDLVIRAFHGRNQFDLGVLPSHSGAWKEHRVSWSLHESLAASPAETFLQDISLSGIHGSGRIGIRDVAVFNAEGDESHVLIHGLPAWIKVRYTIRDPEFEGKAQVVLALHQDGVNDVCRFITRDLIFRGHMPRGTIHLRIPKLSLGNGTYTITVMIAKEGYYDRGQVVFYSINPDVYVCASRILEFNVVHGGLVATGTGVVADGDWSIEDESE